MKTKTDKKMIDHLWAVKIGAAATGSSIAVVFRKGGNWKIRLLIGFIMGMIIAPYAMEFWSIPKTLEFYASTYCASGIVGYLALQILFSKETREALKNRIS